MKNIFSLSVAMLLFGTLFFASCAKEEDPEPMKFQGIWSIAENSKDYGTSNYNLTISDSSNASYLLIAYLYGFNQKIYAVASGSSLTIPKQTIQGNSVSGSGVLTSPNRMDLKYFVQSTSTHTDEVIAVLTK